LGQQAHWRGRGQQSQGQNKNQNLLTGSKHRRLGSFEKSENIELPEPLLRVHCEASTY
jgi:hypothetical protein